MSKIKKQLAAVAFALLATGSVAQAGRGGSAANIRNAVLTHSVDAIIAEVERAEHLVCQDCGDIMMALVHDNRFEIRQVAAWWFAKRPSVKDMMIEEMTTDLATTDSIAVRDAADFLGRVKAYTSLDELATAFTSGVDAGARLAIVRSAGQMGARSGNALLVAGMADADASVRLEAAKWYRDIRGQSDAAPLVPLLTDAEPSVRGQAAASVGGLRGAGGRAILEQMVVNDPDAAVRRNAAWALGRIGDFASRDALLQAKNDASGLVRRTATVALGLLR